MKQCRIAKLKSGTALLQYGCSWGGYRISVREGDSRYGPSKAVPCILPCKIFTIEVVGNGISGILRLSQRVIMSHFFKFGGSSEPHEAPLKPPSCSVSCGIVMHKCIICPVELAVTVYYIKAEEILKSAKGSI